MHLAAVDWSPVVVAATSHLARAIIYIRAIATGVEATVARAAKIVIAAVVAMLVKIVIVMKFWAKLVSCAATQVTVVVMVMEPVGVVASSGGSGS